MKYKLFGRKRNYIFILLVVITGLLNVMAWNSTSFCDWYIANVFPIWVNTYGRLTGMFPFSVGEWLIAAGLVITLIAFVSGIALIFCRRSKAGKVFSKLCQGYVWIVAVVCLVMTLNCMILYHASPFSEQYFQQDDGEYTATELMTLYQQVVTECNALCEEILRDENGKVIYTGMTDDLLGASEKEIQMAMADEARLVMRKLGEDYPQLDGWYPRPKAMFFSDFMCQQHMKGYYFPFSMEANYNDVMHLINFPSTMCHELAHLRGYIFEDEANLIGYLACMESEDAFFSYSGNLSVLTYICNDLNKLKKNNPEQYQLALEEVSPVAVKKQVWADNIFVTDEEWERINQKALLDTDLVDKAADVFVDTNLKINGVSDGKVSYSRVVKLLLQYNRNKQK